MYVEIKTAKLFPKNSNAYVLNIPYHVNIDNNSKKSDIEREWKKIQSEQIHTYQHVHHILVDLLYREFAREIHFR